MRVLRAIGLMGLGVAVGVLAMSTGTKATAQAQPTRFALGAHPEWAGKFAFYFMRDTRTSACYLISLNSADNAKNEVTAMVRADDASCY